jgi:hypothetical protein
VRIVVVAESRWSQQVKGGKKRNKPMSQLGTMVLYGSFSSYSPGAIWVGTVKSNIDHLADPPIAHN